LDHGTQARVARERAAYDSGDVLARNAELQGRFSHVFTCPNSAMLEARFAELTARWAAGADVLDYGCHMGWFSERIASAGPASITGIDISPEAIAEARAARGHLGRFEVMDAMAMSLPDASFDLVVGRAILHHLDIDRAVAEIDRVLRPGGHALFMEPLGDNPSAKLYRALTPAARTSDERPLARGDIARADARFGSAEHAYAGLLSVPLGMVSSVVSKRPDNAVMRLADTMDRAAARTPLRHWMRVVVLAWRKPS
jgi:SAM-dependent methyltransferase